MSREDKILLLTNGAFCVGSLLLLLYLPQNTAFYIPNIAHALLYIPPFACFMLFLKKRGRLKPALAVTWLACAVFFCCALMYGVARMYANGGVMVN